MSPFARGGGTLRRAPLRTLFVAEQTMSMPAASRRWTVEEVRAMQDEERAWPRYELIDGELLVTPAPRRLHQHTRRSPRLPPAPCTASLPCGSKTVRLSRLAPDVRG